MSAEEVAESYADDIGENQRLCGSFACDAKTMEDLLLARAALERLGYVPDTDVAEADKIVLEEGISPHYSYVTKHGPEWPLHLPEIQRGQFPLDELPPHLRELARRLYYGKVPS